MRLQVMIMVTWFPILVTLVLAGIVVGVMVNINALIGPKRVTAVKMESFECGNPPSGSAWGRFSVRFYLTALLFLVFDVEVIFLYPWAVELRRLGDVWIRRGAHLHRDSVRRPDLRMGARRARLGLSLECCIDKLKEKFGADKLNSAIARLGEDTIVIDRRDGARDVPHATR